jgi:predicted glycosyltransferase
MERDWLLAKVHSWACNSLGNLEELREYNLIYCYHPNNEKLAINKAMDIIVNDDIKKIWQNKAKKFINDRIDLTSFLFWFIENYPESHKIMKENPEYQNRFK